MYKMSVGLNEGVEFGRGVIGALQAGWRLPTGMSAKRQTGMFALRVRYGVRYGDGEAMG
jgi:hypothetical protein